MSARQQTIRCDSSEQGDKSQQAYVISLAMAETHGVLSPAFCSGKKLPVFLDISPDSSAANSGRLKAILKWLLPRVSHLTIVEGSFLTRWDFMAFDGLSESDARKKAATHTESVGTRIRRIVNESEMLIPVEFLDWRVLLAQRDFKKVHSAIKAYSDTCPAFALEVHQQAKQFFVKMTGRGRHSQHANPLRLLEEYIIEEISAFIHLHVNEHIPIEIYPGADLLIMRQITKGQYQNFPVSIPDRTHISINIQMDRLHLATPSDLSAIVDIIRMWPSHFVEAAIPLVKADFINGRTFVWKESNSILGFMIWDTDGSDIEMKWMAVAPSATHRGIGSALVTKLINSAKSEKRIFGLTTTLDSIIPGTTFDGTAYSKTIQFFERLGFCQAGVLKRFWGEQNHALVIEKFLNQSL